MASKAKLEGGFALIGVLAIVFASLVAGGAWYYYAIYPHHDSVAIQLPTTTPASSSPTISTIYPLTAVINQPYGIIFIAGSHETIGCTAYKSANGGPGGISCPPISTVSGYTLTSSGALPPGLSLTNMTPPSLQGCATINIAFKGYVPPPCPPPPQPLSSNEIGITGTSTQLGNYPIIITASNASGTRVSQKFTITVVATKPLPASFPKPMLTVSQSGNDQIAVVPGATTTLVGQYSLAASTFEDIRLSTVDIIPNTSNLQGLEVYIGGQRVGRGYGMLYPGSIYEFGGSYVVPAGGNVTVQLFANIPSTATGTIAPATTFDGCSATGVSSSASAPCNVVSGQEVTF